MKRSHRVNLWFYLFFILLCANNCKTDSSSSAEEKHPSFFANIYGKEIVQMILSFDLDTLKHYKNEEKYQPANLKIDLPNTIQVDIEIAARGVTRKTTCDFPPIRIKIPKKVTKTHHWGGPRRNKLVTQCNNSDSMGVVTLKEYLVYQLYEIINPHSLKTQLCKVTYQTPQDTFTNFAFIIEDDKDMGSRLGLQTLNVDKNPPKSVHIGNYRIFALFQYMIGNTDWNLTNGHNTLGLIQDGTQTPIIVPYDFDQCGLVNAPYARPYPSLPISSVRDRLFQYRGKKTDDFQDAIDFFLKQKPAIFDKIAGFKYLPQREKEAMQNYLLEFYDTIAKNNWKDILFNQ